MAPSAVDTIRPVRRHARMSSASVEEHFGYQRTSTCDLPDPRLMLENLSRSIIEILAGVRDPEQISRWVSESTYRHVVHRAVSARRARDLRRRAPSRPTISLGGSRAFHPCDGIVEGTVVVHGGNRSRAVVIRLEGIDGRWRATEIAVL
ncbi:Rv3235 family protein [Humidisolicoccus flavus]|uniref:Rv3235 family protein n=1 Tax=Humidisolicoccus flavus TaxID=3111414 RepID=UPI0032541882